MVEEGPDLRRSPSCCRPPRSANNSPRRRHPPVALRHRGDPRSEGPVQPETPTSAAFTKGYLLLASSAGGGNPAPIHAIQSFEGSDIELIDPPGIQRWPYMSTEGVALAAYGRSGEGWFDAWMWLDMIRTIRRQSGQRTLYPRRRHQHLTAGDRVFGHPLRRSRDRLRHLRERRRPSAGDVTSALSGIALPRAAQTSSSSSIAAEEIADLPMLIDGTSVASGVYIAGASISSAASPRRGDRRPRRRGRLRRRLPSSSDLIWPALAIRIPPSRR